MSKKIKVGIIFGGKSGEHEVSLVSATSVRDQMPKDKYEIKEIGISKDGEWFVKGDDKKSGGGSGLIEDFKNGEYKKLKPVSFEEALKGCDIAFPVLHGSFGEDGTIQGLFEMIHIPYVGCGVLASSLCMDKINAKRVMKECGIPVVPYVAFTLNEWEADKKESSARKELLARIEKELGIPCFVKPSNMGSSVGISKVKNLKDLEKAIEAAGKFDNRILVEKAINAREIECAVLGNDEPKAALLGEIIVKGEFYDYNDKYVDGKSYPEIPVKNVDDTKQTEIQDFCLRAYKALDCAGLARVDCFLERETGEVYMNEVNTIPGFTAISMFPKMWVASGVNYSELLDELVQLGFEKFKEKEKNQIGFDSGSDWFRTS